MDDSTTVNFIRDQLKQISNQLDRLDDDVKVMRDNHLHHLEVRVERMETSIRVGWKLIAIFAGLPAMASSVMSIINLLK